MTDNTPEIDNLHTAGSDNTPSPGQQLKEAREQAGLSRKELSDRLCLVGTRLQMLEEDCYDRLPSPLYVRGYIRNACKELGIDERPLLAAYAERTGEEGLESETPEILSHISRGPSLDERKGGFHWLVMLPLLLVGGVFWWVQGREAAPPAIFADNAKFDGSALQEETRQTPGAQVEVERPSAATELSDTEDAAVPTTEKAPELDTAPAPDTASQSEPVQPATAAAERVAAPRAEEPQPAGPQDSSPESSAPVSTSLETDASDPAAVAPGEELQLSFDEEAWVEVKDATGKVLLAKLRPAGSEEVLTGQPPFSVMLGNAVGTHVRYRGELIDSDPLGSRRTRRLTVGE